MVQWRLSARRKRPMMSQEGGAPEAVGRLQEFRAGIAYLAWLEVSQAGDERGSLGGFAVRGTESAPTVQPLSYWRPLNPRLEGVERQPPLPWKRWKRSSSARYAAPSTGNL